LTVKLLLIRHGEPDTAGPPRPDPPLSAAGRAQGEALAAWLAGESVAAVYTSPLRRARQTAEPLAVHLGHDVTVHDGVAEYDRNSSAYIPMEDLKKTNYEAWRRRMTQKIFAANPDAFRNEVATAMEEIIEANRGRRVVVFCHGGVINAWGSHVMGTKEVFFFDPTYTSINRFMAAGSGERTVISLNDTAHLRD